MPWSSWVAVNGLTVPPRLLMAYWPANSITLLAGGVAVSSLRLMNRGALAGIGA
jgi:hypothetical protein